MSYKFKDIVISFGIIPVKMFMPLVYFALHFLLILKMHESDNPIESVILLMLALFFAVLVALSFLSLMEEVENPTRKRNYKNNCNNCIAAESKIVRNNNTFFVIGSRNNSKDITCYNKSKTNQCKSSKCKSKRFIHAFHLWLASSCFIKWWLLRKKKIIRYMSIGIKIVANTTPAISMAFWGWIAHTRVVMGLPIADADMIMVSWLCATFILAAVSILYTGKG